MTKTVDQWAAEACGVELYTKRCTIPDAYDTYSGTGIAHWFDQTIGDYGEWTIKDPRCREIFRNLWLSQGQLREVQFTIMAVHYCDFRLDDETAAFELNADGGETACITAIFEASQ